MKGLEERARERERERENWGRAMAGGFFSAGGRIRELFAKYGKVAIAVHLSVSGISISAFYVAIKNNVDVEGVLNRIGLLGKDEIEEAAHRERPEVEKSDDVRNSREAIKNEQYRYGSFDGDVGTKNESMKKEDAVVVVVDDGDSDKNSNVKKSALISGGSALVLAILCNKAMFPVRVPLTFALTPPVARFLARRKLYNSGIDKTQ